MVMSLVSLVGPRPNLLDTQVKDGHMRLEVKDPILTNEELEKIRGIASVGKGGFRSATLDITYPVKNGAAGMKAAIDQLRAKAEAAIANGDNIIILSDRALDKDRVAIPALLATGAVHHHLIRKGLRTQAGLVVETGEAREVHHFCVLAEIGRAHV